MKTFANLFLILFTADGFLSLLNELANLLSPLAELSAVQAIVANLVLLLAVPLYLCLGFDRRLPKRVFIPLIVFVYLCPLLPWLIPPLEGFWGVQLLLSAVQLGLCSLPISRFGREDRAELLMRPEHFEGQAFALKNTLVFLGVNILIVPIALGMLLLNAADAYSRSFTGGFMRVAPNGLRMAERTYTRDGKTIRLAAMIHIGEKEFYEQMARSVGSGRTIVLAEGVIDSKGLIADKLDYGRVADVLGLKSQEVMLFKGRVIDEEDLEEPAGQSGAGQADILRADVDVSSFKEPTLRFLNAFAKHMQGVPATEGLQSFNKWVDKNFTPEMQRVLMDDILTNRNKELLRHLQKALPRYDTVVIPWGALHMPGIEQALKEQGFALQQERERTSINWLRILAGKL